MDARSALFYVLFPPAYLVWRAKRFASRVIARTVCKIAGRDPDAPLRRRAPLVWLVMLALAGCGPLDSWNKAKAPSSDPDGCPPEMHNVRGPDAYDVAHGEPYHCEASGPDLQYQDVDPLEMSP
jgi:hypothetical protein